MLHDAMTLSNGQIEMVRSATNAALQPLGVQFESTEPFDRYRRLELVCSRGRKFHVDAVVSRTVLVTEMTHDQFGEFIKPLIAKQVQWWRDAP